MRATLHAGFVYECVVVVRLRSVIRSSPTLWPAPAHTEAWRLRPGAPLHAGPSQGRHGWVGGEEDMQPQTKHSRVGPGTDVGRTWDGRGTAACYAVRTND